jgi:DNA-binding MarR family transcriptional regulator
MLGTLERAGWVSRHRDPGNRRSVLVALTPEGRAKLASVPRHLWRSGETRPDPEACLSLLERARLARSLEKLNGWLERLEARPRDVVEAGAGSARRGAARGRGGVHV